MITKEQAVKLGDGTLRGEIHCVAVRCCTNVFGSRGGVKTNRVIARPNGRCQTWKTRPNDFRLPVKHGMYEYGEITQDNADCFHLASDCPAEAELEAYHRQNEIDRQIASGLQAAITKITPL